MAYEDYCAACTYLGETADCYGKYFCPEKYEDHLATDPKCNSFCEAYGRSDSARKNMYENSASHSDGCYITTIICEILGYPDNHYCLETLRNFRDNKMTITEENMKLLAIYDIIGPQIAENLSHNSQRKMIAKSYFQTYIINAVEAILENRDQAAINIYTEMTNRLAYMFNIDYNNLTIDLNNVDMNTLGHGRTKVRKLVQNAR